MSIPGLDGVASTSMPITSLPSFMTPGMDFLLVVGTVFAPYIS